MNQDIEKRVAELRAMDSDDWAETPLKKIRWNAEAALAIIDAQAAEIARYRGALEWYAATVRECRKINDDGAAAEELLDDDGGDRARAALEPRP